MATNKSLFLLIYFLYKLSTICHFKVDINIFITILILYKQNKRENMIKIHETALIGFEQIVAMLKSKKVFKNKSIIVSLKDLKKFMSPISISILRQLSLKTLKDGRL